MSTVGEITLPETKPATEWVNGRALQKVSPQRQHARAQARICAALLGWVARTGFGEVGTEWEFRVTPPGEITRPLIPDVSYISYDRLPEDERAAEIPYMAPDVAVEVRSPDDQLRDINEKIRVYLAAGAKLVLLADPQKREFVAYDPTAEHTFSHGEVFAHDALPGFSMRVPDAFEAPRRRSPG